MSTAEELQVLLDTERVAHAETLQTGLAWKRYCEAERAANTPIHLTLMDPRHPLESLMEAAQRAVRAKAELAKIARDLLSGVPTSPPDALRARVDELDYQSQNDETLWRRRAEALAAYVLGCDDSTAGGARGIVEGACSHLVWKL